MIWNIITHTVCPPSVLGERPKFFGCCSSGQVTFQTGTKRDSRRRQHHTFFLWYGHMFFFCAVFYFFPLCFLFTAARLEPLQNVCDEALPMTLLCISLWISPSWWEYLLLFWSLSLLFAGLILETIFSAIVKTLFCAAFILNGIYNNTLKNKDSDVFASPYGLHRDKHTEWWWR